MTYHFLPPVPEALPNVSDAEYDSLIKSGALIKPEFKSRHEFFASREGHSHINKNCVTCKGEGDFLWLSEGERVTYACPCLDQWALDSVFAAANIVKGFRTLGIDDCEGIPFSSQEFLVERMENPGSGSFLIVGDHASGKTLMATLLMRKHLERGLTSYLTRPDDMRDQVTSGFDDDEVKARYEKKVRNVDLLVVDEMNSVKKVTPFMADNLVRIIKDRENQGRDTLLLSTKGKDWLAGKYTDEYTDEASSSDISEISSMIRAMEYHHVSGTGFGQRLVARGVQEKGLTRPRVLI